MSALGILTSCLTIAVVSGVAYILLCGCSKDQQKNRVEQRRKNPDAPKRRKEIFVRVGAETPEDDCEDPSPPLAVVQAPLKLGPRARRN